MSQQEFKKYWSNNKYVKEIADKYLDEIRYYNISFEDMIDAFHRWTGRIYYYEKIQKNKIKRFN